jgi:hypothetical protein
MPTNRRRRRLITPTILAVLTVGTLAAGASVAGASPATGARRPLRAVTVQDPLETGDAIADLRSASVAVSRGLRHLTVTARFEQPTSPTCQNWWFGSSLPRGGITWASTPTAPRATGSTWPSSAVTR